MANFEQVNWTVSSISNSTNSSKGNRDVEDMEYAIISFAVIIVGGFVSNATVILLVLAKRVRWKTINLLMANMAIADLMMLLLQILFTLKIYLTQTDWPGGFLGEFSCTLTLWLLNSTHWVSLVTLLIISIERLKAISSAIQRPHRDQRLILLIFISWILPGLINAPMLFISGVKKVCGCFYTKPTAVYYVCTNGLYLCLVISILSINLKIVRTLVHGQAAINLPEAQQQRRLKTFRSAVHMVVCSLLLFVFCTAPLYTVLALLRLEFLGVVYLKYDHTLLTAIEVLHILFHINPAFGPAIYFIFIDDFRKAMIKVLKGLVWFKQEKSEQHLELITLTSRAQERYYYLERESCV